MSALLDSLMFVLQSLMARYCEFQALLFGIQDPSRNSSLPKGSFREATLPRNQNSLSGASVCQPSPTKPLLLMIEILRDLVYKPLEPW